MSTLTKCCACGCTPEQLFWVTPGSNAIASVPEGTLPTGPTGCVQVGSFTSGTSDFHRLIGDCNSLAVTTETDRDTLVLDVRVNPPAIGPGTFVPNAKAFDIELKLWCDGNGQEQLGTVRLWAELGSRLQDTQFTQDPESFATATPSFGPFVVYNTCWFKVYASLIINDQFETVQVICPTTQGVYFPGSNNYREESVFAGIAFRVTATYADEQCDVNVSYTTYPAYAEAARINYSGYSELGGVEIEPTFSPEDPGAMGWTPYGTLIQGFPPARRHAFSTATTTRQHKRVGATIEDNESWKWTIGIRAKSYSPNHPPAVPAVPDASIDQCVCTPTGATGPADCFIERTQAGTVKPEDPYRYPWFMSPCSHVRRGSRVTHGRVVDQFENLSVTLPACDGAPYDWNGYVSQMPAGPYELSGALNGTTLADDTFWLAAGSIPTVVGTDAYYGQTGFRTDSVTIAASIRTTLIRTGGPLLLPLTVLTPCPGDADEWITAITIFVYMRGRFAINYDGGAFPADSASQPFAVWMTHAHFISSAFFRGTEISIPIGSGCRAQWMGGFHPNPFTTDTLYELTYTTPLKVQLMGG